ncbi:MAG: dipeptidase [Clostridiales bacterium]|nr:dipeptidase [Clostridiales bacterium]
MQKKIPLFDGHCDTLSRLNYVPQEHIAGNSGHWDLDKMQRFAPQAQVMSLFWDSAKPFTRHMVKQELRTFKREVSIYRDRAAFCTNMEEAKAAWKENKVALFLSIEGAELWGCTLDDLEKAYAAGVRIINLTWNHANALSGSNAEEPERGLSEAGRAYVQRMQKLHMLVDVSHLSDQGFWDVMELTKMPVIASHSNSRAVQNHPRNLTDEMFTAIMKWHGVAGLNVYTDFLGQGKVTEDDLLRHLEHFLALGGSRAVALGGDWDGCRSLPEGYTGIWSWANLYERLLRENYSEELVNDLFFHNFARVMNKL